MTETAQPARTRPARDGRGRVTPDAGGYTGAALDRRRPGVARRRVYQLDELGDRPTLDRPQPYRTLRAHQAPPPLYQTPVPRRAVGSYGDAAADWLQKHLPGWRAQAWQRDALRLVLQHDRRGRILARTALIGVPRQNGKTTLSLALIGWWMDEGPGGNVLGAATQRRQARLVYDQAYRLFSADPDLRQRARVTAHDGIYLGSSVYQTVSREAGSARGWSASLVYFDELLTQTDAELWDALRYAQAAATDPLLVATSTAGFADSLVLNDLEDRGVRIATGQEKPDPSYVFAWWGVPPDVPLDAAAIQRANPAVASRLLDLATIQAERTTSAPGAFRRERLNQRTRVLESVLPPGAWEACQAPATQDVPERWTLAVDAAPHWQRATLAAAWEQETSERVALELVRDMRGTDADPIRGEALRAAVLEVAERRKPSAILYERSAACAPVMERLEIEHPQLPIQGLTAAQVFEASGLMFAAITTRQLAHLGDPLLAAQWTVAARAERDGVFRWTRRRSAGYIDAVMAATMALWGARQGVAPEPPVQVFI